MSLRTWKCLTCGKEFKVGEWSCADGQSNHVIEKKEYLVADAPTDPGHPASGGMDSKRDGRTRICNIPPDKTVIVNGETQRVPGGYVEFVRGRYSTSDPEIQYCLEKTRSDNFCSEAQWEQAWLSQGQQLELERGKLDSMRLRLENERNELLAQVKQQKSEKVAVTR
jgi:hypothetical protein